MGGKQAMRNWWQLARSQKIEKTELLGKKIVNNNNNTVHLITKRPNVSARHEGRLMIA